jgi:hypothetical protein
LLTKRWLSELDYSAAMSACERDCHAGIVPGAGRGAAYAASHLDKNSVGAKQLKRNAVTGAKVKDGSLSAGDFKAGQLPSGARGPQGIPGVPGAPGLPGAPGATQVVVRYGNEGKPKEGEFDQSNAKCLPGEGVTGGGFDFFDTEPTEFAYTVEADRPSAGEAEVEGELVYPAPDDGSPANGWLVAIQNESDDTIFFRAYVMCARP